MLNRSKLLAAGLLLAAFVAGLAVGSAASAAWGDSGRGEALTRDRRVSYAEHLQTELDLSGAQRESVDQILERRKTQMDAIWREIAPRFDTLRTGIRSEIMQLLDEGQQEAYQALIARSDSLRALRRHGGRHGRK